MMQTPGGGLLTPQIKSPSDLFSFSHLRNSTRMEDSRLGALRSVSSSTHGITATVKEQLMTLSQPTRRESPDRSAPHPRIGIGLPMSNIFATSVVFALSLVIYRFRADVWCIDFQVFWWLFGACQHGWIRFVLITGMTDPPQVPDNKSMRRHRCLSSAPQAREYRLPSRRILDTES